MGVTAKETALSLALLIPKNSVGLGVDIHHQCSYHDTLRLCSHISRMEVTSGPKPFHEQQRFSPLRANPSMIEKENSNL